MNIEVRVYKRYDTDILALHDAGYSITKMMTDAVIAYANGRPCHFFVDEILPFDMNDKKNVRLRLKINNNDYNTIRLLKDIKHGYKSNFCKQVLRNAMIQQNLTCYFSDMSFLPLHEANANNLNMQAYPNLIMCSQYRRLTQKLNIMGNDVTITHEKGYTYNPAENINNKQPKNSMPQSRPAIQPQQQEYRQPQIYQQVAYTQGYQQMPVLQPYAYADSPYGTMVQPLMQDNLHNQQYIAQPVQSPVSQYSETRPPVPVSKPSVSPVQINKDAAFYSEKSANTVAKQNLKAEEKNDNSSSIDDSESLMAMFDNL